MLTVTVLLMTGIGDHVLAFPALRALADDRRVRVRLICRKGPIEQVLALLDADIIPIAWRGNAIEDFDVAEMAAAIGRTDVFASTMYGFSDKMKALITTVSCGCSVGFARGYDVYLQAPLGEHEFRRLFQLARFVNAEVDFDRHCTPLSFPQSTKRMVDGLLASLAGYKRLVVHTETQSSKQWPTERWQHTLSEFLAARPDFVALTLSVDDVGLSGDRVYSLHGLGLQRSLYVASTARLFAGIDSCMLHVADLSRIPSLSLISSDTEVRWGTLLAPKYPVTATQLTDVHSRDVLRHLLEMARVWGG